MAASLADDEAKLAEIADTLLSAIDNAFDGWIVGLILNRLDTPGSAEQAVAASAATDARNAVMPSIETLLRTDLDEQRTSPLHLLRTAVGWPNRVLAQHGVQPPQRDEFAERSFPSDTYDLSPASFADISETLTEPGLVWGAAKAHVHLRRRRETTPEMTSEATPVTCAYFVPDLMDQSKLRGALPDAVAVRSPNKLAACTETLVVVDLGRLGSFEHIARITGDVLGFGSHVDEEMLEQARSAGCVEVLPRSVFFRRLAECDGDPSRLLSSPQ